MIILAVLVVFYFSRMAALVALNQAIQLAQAAGLPVDPIDRVDPLSPFQISQQPRCPDAPLGDSLYYAGREECLPRKLALREEFEASVIPEESDEDSDEESDEESDVESDVGTVGEETLSVESAPETPPRKRARVEEPRTPSPTSASGESFDEEVCFTPPPSNAPKPDVPPPMSRRTGHRGSQWRNFRKPAPASPSMVASAVDSDSDF